MVPRRRVVAHKLLRPRKPLFGEGVELARSSDALNLGVGIGIEKKGRHRGELK